MNTRASIRQSGHIIWQVLNRLLVGMILLTLLAMAVLAFIPELQKQKDAKQELRRLENAISNEEQMRQRKERELELLKTDPEYVEIIARDKMDLMKEGETIFRLKSSPHKSPPSTAQ